MHGNRALAAHAAGQPVEDDLEAGLRAVVVVRRKGCRLCQVIEGDHDVRNVEQRLGQADRIRFGDREPLPARGDLVRQVPNTGIHRKGEWHGAVDARQHTAKRLERIGRGEPVDPVVVGVPDDGLVPVYDDGSAAHADERVAAVPRAALDALEDERQAVTEPEGRTDRSQGVSADLDGGDRNRRGGRERCQCIHRCASPRSIARSVASRYPCHPLPMTWPATAGSITETARHGSRALMLLTWISTTGRSADTIASSKA